MRVSDEQDLVAKLRELGYRVQPPPPKVKPPRCSVCGAIEDDVLFSPVMFDLDGIDLESDDLLVTDYLIRVKVEVGERGEEGWDFAIKWFCEVHCIEPIEALMALGYTTHHHGSTHPLADDENCGYGCDKQGSPYDEEEK